MNIYIVSNFWLLWIRMLWILGYKFLYEHMFSVLLGKYLEVDLLGHVATLCSTFEGLPTISHSSCTIDIPTSSISQGSSFSTFSLTLVFVFFFFLKKPLQLHPLPLTLSKEEKNNHRWPIVVAKTPPTATSHSGTALHLLLVVSGAPGVQKNVSSNKL